MRMGTVTVGFLLVVALAGCQGSAGSTADDLISYKFEAKVAVNPAQPVTNKRVSFNLEVTSTSTRDVTTDIILKVVSADGELLYQSVWNDVLFREHEVWNLTQGFFPDADAGSKAWRVQILVRNQATGEILYDQSLAQLDFAS